MGFICKDNRGKASRTFLFSMYFVLLFYVSSWPFGASLDKSPRTTGAATQEQPPPGAGKARLWETTMPSITQLLAVTVFASSVLFARRGHSFTPTDLQIREIRAQNACVSEARGSQSQT